MKKRVNRLLWNTSSIKRGLTKGRAVLISHVRYCQTERKIRRTTFHCLSAGLWLLFATGAANAQNYSIDWHQIAGGGGTSTGGVFSVSGTIGQADAGAMTGGNYSLTGGFWSLIAVQTPGAPLLTITPAGSNFIISWPSASSGFGLQENPDLNPANWSAIPATNSDNGTIKSITLSAGAGNRYYRLAK